MKRIIGIDIGGTKISLILATERGKLLSWKTIKTQKFSKARRSVQDIIRSVHELLKSHSLRSSFILGIGIGFPGPVNPATGIVPWSPNLQGWKGIPLKRILESEFKVPVIVDNDANAAGFGEKVFGQGKKVKSLIYMTVSTGVGGGIVIGGKIHRGASFCGGEVGHMTLVPDGPRCNCGKRGCLEALASGTAIARMARSRAQRGSRLAKMAGSVSRITGKTVTDAAAAGDRLSIQILAEAGRYLGIGVANLLNVLNPEMVVIGGSVMKSGRNIWQPMIQSARKEAWPDAFKACKIRRTALGDHVGNLGAAALVLEQLS